jgi:hypothetical protein
MDFGLIDLLKPHFLAGFDLPESIHNIIAFLRVNELQTSWDKCGVVYSGKASFVGEGNASPVPKYRSPSGSFWEWEDVNIRFRLTVPRRGSDQIKNAVKGIDSLKTALEKLESTDNGSPSDYPGFESASPSD